ncbi:MAG: DUF2232 domain-containing protein [Gammaproteobacteria bacterium]|nr:DUF2232 domain-containing protein [Gammaproteobacteria bacterium]MBU1653346.1 DUF2232 domain-containing protein [Gammaproteobacteria bacterium]MBU1962774.1 DUF2232 domain-containing protein [Gammaproteobacteria bacterium]
MIAAFVMRGRLQAVGAAILFALLALLFPPLVIASTAVIGLVAMRRGGRPGLEVILLSALILAVLGLGFFGNPSFAAVSLVVWLPVWVLGLVLRYSQNLSLTVQLALLLGLVPLALEFFVSGTEGWGELLGPLKESLEKSQVLPPDEGAEVMAWLALWLTAFMGAGLFLQTCLGLFLARSWQAKLYNPGGFRTEFHAFRVSRTLAYAATLFLLLLFLVGGSQWSLVRLAAVMMLVIYFLQGLAVMHALLARSRVGEAWMLGVYALLVFALPYMAMTLAATGFVDAWWDLRKADRKGRPNDAGDAGDDD